MTSSDTTSTGFDVTHWCDYARGIRESASLPAMRDELDRCESARRTVRLFERVSSVAEVDRAAELPAYAVRIVKAVAGLQPHTRPCGPLRFLPLSLTFDSLRAAPLGTRDFLSSHQRITSYRAADFSVHVKLEQETNPQRQVVVGQLLHHDPEPRPVSDVPILALSNGRVVARSVTGRFGEFQADGLPPDPLKLYLLLGSDECIDIPLGDSPQEA